MPRNRRFPHDPEPDAVLAQFAQSNGSGGDLSDDQGHIKPLDSANPFRAPLRQIGRFFQVFGPGEEPPLDAPAPDSPAFVAEIQAKFGLSLTTA